jgi:hypothetical protein
VSLKRALRAARSGYNPKTGSDSEMSFGQGQQGPGGVKAQSQVKAAPAPFANPSGSLKPVPSRNHFEESHTGNLGGKVDAGSMEDVGYPAKYRRANGLARNTALTAKSQYNRSGKALLDEAIRSQRLRIL